MTSTFGANCELYWIMLNIFFCIYVNIVNIAIKFRWALTGVVADNWKKNVKKVLVYDFF